MERRMVVAHSECPARMVPSGTPTTIPAGSFVTINQALGGNYTVTHNGNMLRVDGTDAAAYLSRIQGLGPAIDTLVEESKERAAEGIMPPDWVYPYVISDIENLLAAGDDNAILEDYRKKVGEIDGTRPAAGAAEKAWNESARPAYERLLNEMKRQQAIAPSEDGIWRFPEGAGYYEALLRNYTTTDLTADQVHQIGLRSLRKSLELLLFTKCLSHLVVRTLNEIERCTLGVGIRNLFFGRLVLLLFIFFI